MRAALLLMLLLQDNAPQEPPKGTERTGIAAKVNGEIITWEEIELRLREFAPEERTDELRLLTRRDLAKNALFLQYARHYKVTVTEQDIDERVDHDKKMLGGNEAFERFLRRIIRKTLSQYREQTRRQLMIQGVYRRLVSEARFAPTLRSVLLWESVSPEELREYWKNNQEQFAGIHQITVYRLALTFRDEEERRVKMEAMRSLRRKLDEGTDFAALALYASEVQPTDKHGRRFPIYRDLKREQSEFSPETTALLFDTLKEGEVSAIVEDRNTINLFKLESRIDREEETFEEAQKAIRAQLENRKRMENGEILLRELLKQSYFEPADLFK